MNRIRIKKLKADIPFKTAWALCNLLHDDSLARILPSFDPGEAELLQELGKDLGKALGHPSQLNGKDLTEEFSRKYDPSLPTAEENI